jgi:hypothetical protein
VAAEAAAAGAGQISLIASLLRFLEFDGAGGAPSGVQHPALAVLESVYPTLRGVVQSRHCADAAVAASLCNVYERVVLCAKVRNPSPAPLCLLHPPSVLWYSPSIFL